MVIEKERVVFENGCIPYRHGTITLNNFQPKSKNPRIAYVFNNMGLADELGSGVRNMYKYNEIYSKAAPTFIEGEVFKTIIALVPELTNDQTMDYKLMFINYIKENQSINRNKAIELSGLGRTKVTDIINELVTENIIERKGKGPATIYVIK